MIKKCLAATGVMGMSAMRLSEDGAMKQGFHMGLRALVCIIGVGCAPRRDKQGCKRGHGVCAHRSGNDEVTRLEVWAARPRCDTGGVEQHAR